METWQEVVESMDAFASIAEHGNVSSHTLFDP
jgi:hypothetical protein